jgi:hypothetical protein
VEFANVDENKTRNPPTVQLAARALPESTIARLDESCMMAALYLPAPLD